MNLTQELLKKGMLGQEEANALEFEVRSSGKSEEELIVEKGLLKEDLLFSFKSDTLKIPLKDVAIDSVSLETLELVPEETAKFYKMIPLAKKEKELQVGMVYPEDLKAQEALKFLSRQENFTYQVFLISSTTFANLLKQYRNLKKEVGQALQELKEEVKSEKIPRTAEEFERLAEEAPISKIVAVILRHAAEGEASDIHIEPTQEKLRIRFRVSGVLHSSILLPIKIHPAVVARIKILANLKIDETRVPQDGRFSTKVDGKNIDFRVSVFPTTLGEKVAIRVLDPTIGLKKFEDIGLTGRNLEKVKEAILKPYGLILSTGPTGSGKTTTLYAILQLFNKEELNIITLEDPAEYFLEGVNQSQVRPEIGYDFSVGLRHILRQDPNVIMVGEIRDEETASLVTHAALTGHIVLSTLHTTNALGVVPRLIDLGVKPYLIPPTLAIAVAQRLVRKLCPECRKKVKPKKEIQDLIQKEIENLPSDVKKEVKIPKPFQTFEPVGCKKCQNTGFIGRIAVFEVLSMTTALADIVLTDPSEARIAEEAKAQGMMTMKQDGVLKALEGTTTIEEVLRVAEEK
ncbi:MAG: type II/IV secretion system protein [Candidatus Nealsonbacteria bacterium]|nr:type II/IV secretion system protein [Candidatus Nealsonbacteria bacterium]